MSRVTFSGGGSSAILGAKPTRPLVVSYLPIADWGKGQNLTVVQDIRTSYSGWFLVLHKEFFSNAIIPQLSLPWVMEVPKPNNMFYNDTLSWGWELSALLMSSLSTIVIAVLLLVYNGKPVWVDHGVTLNAVISVLATTSKTTLMFAIGEAIGQWKWLLFARQPRQLLDMERIDAASRGPFGGAKLLWPRKNFSLLPLGGLLTVLALTIDPFAQQLVQIEFHLRNTTDEAPTISRAQRYSKGMSSSTGVIYPGSDNAFATIDFTMETSILYGLANPYRIVSQQSTFSCPSRNCTWEPFDSLAVCSICSSLDDQIISYEAMNWLWPVLGANLSDGASQDFDGTTFQLPNGMFINNQDGVPHRDGSRTVFMTTYGTGNASKTNALKDIDTLIWAMTILKMPPAEAESWPSAPIEASECGLYYCVKQFTAEVIGGTLFESELLVDAPRNPQSWQPLNEEDFQTLGLDQTVQDSLEFNSTTSALQWTDLMLGDQYNISQSAVKSISNYFQNTFKNQADVAWNVTQRENGDISDDPELVTINGYVLDRAFSPRIIQVFYNTTDINQAFITLARSMTNTMRSDLDGSVTVSGTSQVMTAYYHIVWPWITLHVCLVITGIAFFIITVSKTKIQDVPVWKSHSLAPLSRYDEIGGILVGTYSIAALERKASQHFVTFFGERLSRRYTQIQAT